jgi:hypothetical protein
MKWAFRLPSSSALAGKQVERVSGFGVRTRYQPMIRPAPLTARPSNWALKNEKVQFTVNFGAKPSGFYSVRQRKIQKTKAFYAAVASTFSV